MGTPSTLNQDTSLCKQSQKVSPLLTHGWSTRWHVLGGRLVGCVAHWRLVGCTVAYSTRGRRGTTLHMEKVIMRNEVMCIIVFRKVVWWTGLGMWCALFWMTLCGILARWCALFGTTCVKSYTTYLRTWILGGTTRRAKLVPWTKVTWLKNRAENNSFITHLFPLYRPPLPPLGGPPPLPPPLPPLQSPPPPLGRGNSN